MDEINAAGGKAVGISTDCADGKSVKASFEQLKKEIGGASLAVSVYNVGGRFIRKPFLELSDEEFESGWEANGYVQRVPSTSLVCILTVVCSGEEHSTSPKLSSRFFSRPWEPPQSFRLP